jgi:hypothetical protein
MKKYVLLINNKFHMDAPLPYLMDAIEVHTKKRVEVGAVSPDYKILTEKEDEKRRKNEY